MKTNKTEKAVEKYCSMMIQRMSEIEQGWRKTWLSGVVGMPMNCDGKRYSGCNTFFLWLACEFYGWREPVFVTFGKCLDMGAHVKKGEKSVPVFFYKLIAKAADGKYVDAEKADKDAKVFPVLRSYDVFNVSQTTLAEDAPDKLQKLYDKHGMTTKEVDAEKQYTNDRLDALIGGEWLCGVRTGGGRACYNPKEDVIDIPAKTAFVYTDEYESGMEYYAAALHEMAHSTGHPSRLNRFVTKAREEHDYGREELVAELTAAIVGNVLGFATAVQDNNAAYLRGWCNQIKEKPQYLMTVMADVAKAVSMIKSVIDK